MNQLDLFLYQTHAAPNLFCGLIAIGCMSCFAGNWTGQFNTVFVTLLFFYTLEVIASAISRLGFHNLWYYNIVQIPELLIVLFYFSSKLANRRKQRYYTVIAALFVIVHLSTTTYSTGWMQLNVYTLVSMTAIVGFCALEFLRLQLMDVTQSPFDLIQFWFAIATVFSYFGSVPVTSLYLTIVSLNFELAGKIWAINDVMFSLWYIIPLAGVVWINRQKILYS